MALLSRWDLFASSGETLRIDDGRKYLKIVGTSYEIMDGDIAYWITA